MNPSASGWIPKFLTLIEKQHLVDTINDEILFYNELKTTGFLYGTSIETIFNKPISKLTITTDEYTKINLFHTLLFSFFINNPNDKFNEAIESIINFYKIIEKGKTGFISKLSISRSSTDNLEQIFSARLQETNSILKNRPTTILNYAFLYIDILTYKYYLKHPHNFKNYYRKLESDIINICFLALKAKGDKNKFDSQIIDLLESSTAYLTVNKNHKSFLSLENLLTENSYNDLEKKYILDMCCMAVWNDKKLDPSENQFLIQLVHLLNVPEKEIKYNLDLIKLFSKKNSKKIKLFKYDNPFNLLYNQSTATVKQLVLRNKNRLMRELEESGELVLLLGQSTLRELSTEEKDKVKEQLLDICKTIPSLTIFLIPGGSLLLPLLVKYIPSLLPSAFNENRINSKKDNK